MSHQLTFATCETYDTRLEGITIEASLVLGEQSVTCQVKIDREGWLQKVRFAVVDYDAVLYLSPYQEQV